MENVDRQRILIVDDEEVNRAILKEIFKDEFEILEAENGKQAVSIIDKNRDLVLILLDIIMPKMDGFDVLEHMQNWDLLSRIPVILITSQATDASEDRAYSYGVADVMHKPFYPHIVQRRSHNIIQLYQSRQDMERRLKEQEEEIKAGERKIQENNEFMIDALSSVVEFRSLETGGHIKRVKYFTRVLLKNLVKYFPKYGLTQQQVDEITRASALHDIGKIAIPDSILLKPGKLSPAEREIMKTHTTIGCEILKNFQQDHTGTFYQYCYDICRYHHERWDGKGYPDHLVGDQIPLSAQIVAIADVYDALISERVYKAAYVNTEAHEMIMRGECGQFAPDVLECFDLAEEDFFNMIEVAQIVDF